MVKLQCPAGAANPSPPVGPALGQHGVNIMEFCKAFNARTQDEQGLIIPAVITVYADRTFTFITKTPPASVLLKSAAKIAKGSGEPNQTKVGKVTREQVQRDRAAQDARPERERHRRGDEDRRGHGALDGHRGRGLNMKRGQAVPKSRAERDRSRAAPIRSRRRWSILLQNTPREVRRDGRAGVQPRRRSAPRGPDGARRGRAAARHRQDVRVLVFAKGDKENEAREAGADFVGAEELAKKIQERAGSTSTA